ncbi:unnamed protein product [Allacma fusca]|uniref:Uncharacterized protein n=1 Tax=Allacma fusca TaxID=39272 RepID=A0A8J2PD86_9HEXA|nr:unnamed protein product [Allacma fusca]
MHPERNRQHSTLCRARLWSSNSIESVVHQCSFTDFLHYIKNNTKGPGRMKTTNDGLPSFLPENWFRICRMSPSPTGFCDVELPVNPEACWVYAIK